ncbi:hypothetical protein [Bradyrhizobium canariense]|uniref:hypothetical protein n=1 Tax=Bradyrhizobium canariense TaxID=255045 RepID=UPI000A190E26|nr:hypothetical protein [Bradyrhizobium canariense]OSI33010.1 hypothetical protein BST65_03270 [Bradyrhizobium canariense]OSI36952.1 hypothetical protein BST66_04630 [Bradyrhizobium canariense]OSI55800.1 hypothetical protein BSZ20_01475 [Bradyrhizobium canariense]OSI57792.1 hypothetical protein BST67_01440 [Bradyrhizobium canariense]OSI59076.1 hypothetical protein BSZ15_06370 [Bradyrhizobium canariense]
MTPASSSPGGLITNAAGIQPSREVEDRSNEIRTGLESSPGVQFIALSKYAADKVVSVLRTLHDPDYFNALRLGPHPQETEIAELASRYAAPGVPQNTFVDTSRGALFSAARGFAAATTMASQQSPVSYALCRTPGHHAGCSFMDKYCFLNNVGVAALRFRELVILDLDFHPGNGISDVLSAHVDIAFASPDARTEINIPWTPQLQPALDSHRYLKFPTNPSRQNTCGRFAGFCNPTRPAGWMFSLSGWVVISSSQIRMAVGHFRRNSIETAWH